MDYGKASLALHRRIHGKIETKVRVDVSNAHTLSLAYTPGVAEPCLAIQRDPMQSFELTRRWNTVAVVTDGTAVLGLGDIGPEAGMPVMEGKAALFKAYGGIDAIPLCVRSKDVDEIVRTVELLAGSFGGVNLEDISAPRCFEVERRLKEVCDIPVFHDDQHGTATVVLAGLTNALKVVDKRLEDVRVVTCGAGSAGVAITRLLMAKGLQNVIMCDRRGILCEGDEGLNPAKQEMARLTNREHLRGTLADAVRGADVFIGVSAPGLLTPDMVRSMAPDPIIFACANPTPEIFPDDALDAGAAVVSTGRSDYPNQVNNVLVFPGIFRGALDVRATDINDAMKIAAAEAIAELVSDRELSADYILPKAFDPRVSDVVAFAVMEAAQKSGVARIEPAREGDTLSPWEFVCHPGRLSHMPEGASEIAEPAKRVARIFGQGVVDLPACLDLWFGRVEFRVTHLLVHVGDLLPAVRVQSCRICSLRKLVLIQDQELPRRLVLAAFDSQCLQACEGFEVDSCGTVGGTRLSLDGEPDPLAMEEANRKGQPKKC